MCRATLGATPVNRCTWAASSIFSSGVRGTPGCANTLNLVPVLANAHDGNSICCAFSAAFTLATLCIRCPLADRAACRWQAARSTPYSEVEVVDVGGVEDGRRPQQHGVVRADGERAELAGLERGALLDRELAPGDLGGGVAGQVTQVGRVPQLERFDRAVGHVLLHRVRCTQPGELHLAPVLGRVQHPR